MRALIKFAKESISEMKKVSWPSRDEVIVSTRVVVVSVIIISMILGAIDYLLFYGVNLVL